MSTSPVEIREIFSGALDAKDRVAYLESACNGDVELRRRVADLLDAYDRDHNFLSGSNHLSLVEELKTQLQEILPDHSTKTLTDAPKTIGPFDVLEIIATGGMGTVYLARQSDPSRVVAVKSLRLGLHSEETKQRLRYESQILANLRHPGIAQIFEAGIHEFSNASMPYFAMEYIPEARSITDFALTRQLDMNQRLSLFKQACRAVGYAHEKGVIHRDLKPSNVVVDNQGNLKIIDFGVARTMDLEVAPRSLQTQPGDLLGTLQYMSPEQAHGEIENIDTRSDVYALGIILYELLSNQRPYDVSGLSVINATRMIQETPIPLLGNANTKCRGELETVVEKCLQKDPHLRYTSASALADDIGRYLTGEAVFAKRPSLRYKLKVLVRRHKTWAVTSTIALLLIVVGCILVTVFYQQTLRSRLEVDRVSSALLQMVRMVEPTAQGTLMPPEKILEYVASQIEDDIFKDRPLLEANLRRELGNRFQQLNLKQRAETHLRTAYEIRRKQLGPEHQETLEAATVLANTLFQNDQRSDLSGFVREIYDAQTRVLGHDHQNTLRTMALLANAAARKGNHDEALELNEKSHKILIRKLGKDHPESIWALFRLACKHNSRGRHAKAEELHREVWERRKIVYGANHLDTLLAMRFYAWAKIEQGKFAEAEPIVRENLRLTREAAGPEHERTTFCRYVWGKVLHGLARFQEAEVEFRHVVNIRRQQKGNAALFELDLARTLRSQKRFNEAEELIRSSLAQVLEDRGPQSSVMGTVKSELGDLLLKMERYEEAEPLLLEGYRIQNESRGSTDPHLRFAIERLIQLFEAKKQQVEVETWKRRLEAFHKLSLDSS